MTLGNWLTAVMRFIVLPVVLPISKYVWILLYSPLKCLSRLYVHFY